MKFSGLGFTSLRFWPKIDETLQELTAMSLSRQSIIDELMSFQSGMRIIDTHEHFCPHQKHLDTHFNFFYLFMPYVQYDLWAAGMPKQWLWNPPADDAAVDTCWKTIEPLWPLVRDGAYARAVRKALKEFWEIDDITADNYREIGDLLNQANYPARYQEIFDEKCGIDWVLNQHLHFGFEEPCFLGAFQVTPYFEGARIRQYIDQAGSKACLQGYGEEVIRELEDARAQGARLVKFCVSYAFSNPLRPDNAQAEFERFRQNPDFNSAGEIATWLCDRLLQHMALSGFNAAVHTGVWDDVRVRNPEPMFGVVPRYPEVPFDIYHMGLPYAEVCGYLGKNFPNAYLNLCWSHIVSPYAVRRVLQEWIDVVPHNKIFAFGGDYNTQPELVWAHLQIARENLAEVLAERIMRGDLDLTHACEILQRWFYDNPAAVYHLDKKNR